MFQQLLNNFSLVMQRQCSDGIMVSFCVIAALSIGIKSFIVLVVLYRSVQEVGRADLRGFDAGAGFEAKLQRWETVGLHEIRFESSRI